MAWRYYNTEASQCALLNSAAASLRAKLDVVSQSSVSRMLKRHAKDEKSDGTVEADLIQRIVNLGQTKKFAGTGVDSDGSTTASTTTIDNELVEVDNDDLSEGRAKAILRDKALDIARHKIGRWDASLAMAIMKAVGVDDPNVRVEETTKDLRLVRKYAIGLRENLDKCVEAVHVLQETITGQHRTSIINSNVVSGNESLPKQGTHPSTNRLRLKRHDLLVEIAKLFSGIFVEHNGIDVPKRSSASKSVLFNAGIDTSDPFGWIPLVSTASCHSGSSSRSSRSTFTQGRVGDLAVRYGKTRDAQVEWLLSSLLGLLNEYYQRIEVIESFVYMECVGIQLEKHFSAKRAKLLSAFEKKADISTAINVATRKRIHNLRDELQAKLDALGPDVSHTAVKEAKEAHLESKELKAKLHELAVRRLARARETSTERAITLIALWAKEEEICATEEIKAVGEAMAVLERCVCKEDIERVAVRGNVK
jgi:hypothetical protein